MERTILDALLTRAAAEPDRLLLSTPETELTYGELAARAQGVAARLEASGHARCGHVALHVAEPELLFPALFGIWLSGGVAIPLNVRLPEEARNGILARAKPSHFLVAPGAGIEAAGATTIELTSVSGAVTSKRALVVGERALILFTSGTTGVPKGACQTMHAVSQNAFRTAERLGALASDVLFVNTPPYFTSGLSHFLTQLSVGSSLVWRSGFRFGKTLLDELEEARCTGFGGAPAHLVRALAPLKEPRQLSGVRLWISSGDHLPPQTIRRAQDLLPGVGIYTIYGLTEVSGRLCILPPEDLADHCGTVGRPLRGMQIVARDPEGAALPPGEVGELYVSGDLLMQGYLDDPQRNAAALTEHGFRTGDWGAVDAEGRVRIEGRRDDIFKRGAEKVSTLRIREALLSLDLFSDAAVIAQDDALAGKVPVAFVVPQGELDRPAVMRRLKAILPPASIPSRILPLEAIPRTGSGKAIAAELRKLLPGAER